MAFKAGGNCLRKFLQIMMLLYVCGACIGYQIFMGELLCYMMEQLLPKRDDNFLEAFEFRLIVNAPIAGVILFPLSMKRDMSSLAFAGVFSVAALTYTLFVLVIETPFYYKEWKDKPFIEARAFILDWNIFTSCSLIFFAYTCQMSIMPVYSELVRPNYRRIKTVITRALLTDFVFYLLIANAGYFS